MLFEWDEEKDKINKQKHEMPLKAGIPVFDDLNAIEFEDDRFNYGEERFIVIGVDNRTKVLYVVSAFLKFFLEFAIMLKSHSVCVCAITGVLDSYF
jgi:uncharacterized DUF497 family protein